MDGVNNSSIKPAKREFLINEKSYLQLNVSDDFTEIDSQFEFLKSTAIKI